MFGCMIASTNRSLFLIAILLCNSTYPVIENITQAKDPQGEKTFIFLHDVHFECLVEPVKHFLGAQGSEKLNAVVQEQNKIFQDKLLNILSGKNQSRKNSVLITETHAIIINNSIEKVLNPDTSSCCYQEELLEWVPHLLFTHATKSAVDKDKKASLLQNYLINSLDSANLQVLYAKPSTTFSWIIGDRLRSTVDKYISMLIPRDWQLMKPYVGEQGKNELLKTINIQYVKNHITDLQIFLNQNNIPDNCCETALDIIKGLLAQEKIAESDHLVHVQEYLVQTNQQSIQQALNLNMLKAISKRFDAELLDYIEHLNEIDKDATSVVLLIGNTHAQNVLNILREKGYQIEESLTTDNAQSAQEGFATVIANAQIVNKALQASSLF